MINKTNLTIRDYFEKAGLISQKDRGVKLNQDSGKEGHTRFSELLNTARAGLGKAEKADRVGLTIQDYFKTPVSVRKTPSTTGGVNNQVKPFPLAETPVNQVVTDAAASFRAGKTKAVRIENSIQIAAAKYDLPVELIKGVIKAESNFDVHAVSRSGARGLMQLMPATAKELGVRNSFNIEQNIDGGARYLRQMLDRFGNDTKLALAAYNAGPGAVEKYNGNVPYAETRNYIQKVLSFSRNYA